MYIASCGKQSSDQQWKQTYNQNGKCIMNMAIEAGGHEALPPIIHRGCMCRWCIFLYETIVYGNSMHKATK